jgi:hypothetical protein
MKPDRVLPEVEAAERAEAEAAIAAAAVAAAAVIAVAAATAATIDHAKFRSTSLVAHRRKPLRSPETLLSPGLPAQAGAFRHCRATDPASRPGFSQVARRENFAVA